jgi:hypothetical protein
MAPSIVERCSSDDNDVHAHAGDRGDSASVSGCGGVPGSAARTTGPITAACTVTRRSSAADPTLGEAMLLLLGLLLAGAGVLQLRRKT